MEKSKFQLLEHRLLYVNYKLNPRFNDEDGKLEIEVETETLVDKETGIEDEARVMLILRIYDDKDMEKYPFFIEVAYEGLFSWSDMENFENYLRVNAPSVLLSYIRSIVSNLTSYSDLPVLILPLMDFRTNKISKNK